MTDSLRALLAKATPGPFTADAIGSEGYIIYAPGGRISRQRVAACTWLDWETDKANAIAFAAVLNAAPLMLDIADAVRAGDLVAAQAVVARLDAE